jgi:hypothetical protein
LYLDMSHGFSPSSEFPSEFSRGRTLTPRAGPDNVCLFA